MATPFCMVEVSVISAEYEHCLPEVKEWLHTQLGIPSEEHVKKVLKQFDKAIAKQKEKNDQTRL